MPSGLVFYIMPHLRPTPVIARDVAILAARPLVMPIAVSSAGRQPDVWVEPSNVLFLHDPNDILHMLGQPACVLWHGSPEAASIAVALHGDPVEIVHPERRCPVYGRSSIEAEPVQTFWQRLGAKGLQEGTLYSEQRTRSVGPTMLPAAQPDRPSTGVTIVCEAYKPTGLARMGRELALGLHDCGWSVALRASDEGFSALPQDCARLLPLSHAVEADTPLTVMCTKYADRLGRCGPTVGYTMYECEIPEHYASPLRKLDEVWVPSRWDVELMSRVGIDAHRIPLGVDTAVFRPDGPLYEPLRGYVTHRVLVGFVAAWHLRKGIDVLMPDFLKSMPDAHLVVVAQGWAVAPWRYLEGIERVIVVPDVISDEQLAALYRTLDFLVLPTRAESWCLPVLEASACGTPAVATRCGGLRDHFDEAVGYPVEPDAYAPFGPLRNIPWYCEGTFPELGQSYREAFWSRVREASLALGSEKHEAKRRAGIARARGMPWTEMVRMASGRMEGLR